MGSFRSQPDLVKHTEAKEETAFSYAVTHMCGKKTSIQDGESTWKTHISANLNYPTRRIHYSECSMATVVSQY